MQLKEKRATTCFSNFGIVTKGKKMKKFAINAYETVIYYKVVEANSIEEVRDLLGSGEIEISGDDIVDGDDFNVEEIVEIENDN